MANLKQLYTKDDINLRVLNISSRISEKFKDKDPPIFIGVLNGSFRFIADLIQSISIQCEVDFIKVRSYDGTRPSGNIQLLEDISTDIKNKNIILVEDIIDTGGTIKFLLEKIYAQSPKTISIATLLMKHEKTKLNFCVDYVGFEISQEFVVGYGLDYNGDFRYLNGIYSLNDNCN